MKDFLILVMLLLICTSCSKKPESDFSWSPQNPTAGESVQFMKLSENAKSYSWNLGNLAISSDTDPVHTYESPGDYLVELTASRGLRSDSKTVTLTVSP